MMDESNCRYNILIVDDVPNNIKVAATILSRSQYELFFTTSGVGVLEKVQTTRFDLILLDVMMPEMDGFETCRQLKESPEFKDIPVIFLTAKNKVEDIVTGFQLGAVDYVTKPFKGAELRARVATHLALKRTENALRESKERLKEAQRLARLGWYEFRLKENTVNITPEFLTMLHLPLELAHTTTYKESLEKFLAVVHPDDRQYFRDYYSDESWQQRPMEFRIIGMNGVTHYLHTEARREFDAHGQMSGAFGILHDITERKHLEEELRKLATTDSLTGAANRRHFFEFARGEIKRSQRNHMPLSVMMLDIDHFKRINDSYGHHTGDLALIEVVRVCRDSIRTSDLLARMGGEEFAVLLPETDKEHGQFLAERLRKNIAEIALETSQGKAMFTTSIGLAEFVETDSSLEDTLQRADRALYHAKDSGRNRIVIDTL